MFALVDETDKAGSPTRRFQADRTTTAEEIEEADARETRSPDRKEGLPSALGRRPRARRRDDPTTSPAAGYDSQIGPPSLLSLRSAGTTPRVLFECDEHPSQILGSDKEAHRLLDSVELDPPTLAREAHDFKDLAI